MRLTSKEILTTTFRFNDKVVNNCEWLGKDITFTIRNGVYTFHIECGIGRTFGGFVKGKVIRKWLENGVLIIKK